jgi:flagellar L-ring protein precursor FlgH
MKLVFRIACFGCLLLWSGSLSVQAENLWLRRTPNNGFLFYDTKARNIGDNLTIIITHTTDVENSEDRQMDKSTSSKGTFDVAGSSDGGFGTQGAKASVDLESTSERKFDGSQNYSTTQAFTDRMTATVMDVLPNGNMVITGQRDVRIAGEQRVLVVSGVVRGLDIGPDNTIASQYISDFRLEYLASGYSQKYTRQGWLGRAMNVVWPF